MSAFVRVGKKLIPMAQVESITQLDRTASGKSYVRPEFKVATLGERGKEYRSDDVAVLDSMANTTPDLVGLLFWPEDGRLEERAIIGWRVEHDVEALILGFEPNSDAIPVFADGIVPEFGFAILDRRTGRVSMPNVGSWADVDEYVCEMFEQASEPELAVVKP
ncbi:MAG: hypothetical protein RJA59_1274 [Pseudomonadota bacterium]